MERERRNERGAEEPQRCLRKLQALALSLPSFVQAFPGHEWAQVSGD